MASNQEYWVDTVQPIVLAKFPLTVLVWTQDDMFEGAWESGKCYPDGKGSFSLTQLTLLRVD